jgi:hypothetical protein
MVAPPKKLYWVDFRKNGSKQADLPYGQRRHWSANKGGKFTDRDAAIQRIRELRREWPDATIKLLSVTDMDWKEEETPSTSPHSIP